MAATADFSKMVAVFGDNIYHSVYDGPIDASTAWTTTGTVTQLALAGSFGSTSCPVGTSSSAGDSSCTAPSAVNDACTLANRATSCNTAGQFCDTSGSIGSANTCQEVLVAQQAQESVLVVVQVILQLLLEQVDLTPRQPVYVTSDMDMLVKQRLAVYVLRLCISLLPGMWCALAVLWVVSTTQIKTTMVLVTDQCTTYGDGYTTATTGQQGASAQAGCVCAAGYGPSDNTAACVACATPSFKTITSDNVCL